MGYIAGNLPGAVYGAKLGYRLSGRRSQGGKAGSGVTSQRDVAAVYRRKPMPKAKRTAWKKFVKKVQAVAQKDRGTVSVVMNYGDTQVHPAFVGGVKQQLVKSFHLYGYNANPSFVTPLEVGARDIGKIAGDFVTAGVDDSAKVTFKSAVLDITVTNQAPEGGYFGPLEVDVYHIVYGRKQYPADGLINTFDQGTIQTETFASLPKVNINDRGATPFNVPQAISILGAKILRKKKYFLGLNQSFTYQVRDPKNRIMDLVSMRDKTGFYDPKYTQSVLLVAKPTAIVNETDTFSVTCGSTRTYTCTHEGLNEDASRYYNEFN